jgi:hypothetical protein
VGGGGVGGSPGASRHSREMFVHGYRTYCTIAPAARSGKTSISVGNASPTNTTLLPLAGVGRLSVALWLAPTSMTGKRLR